MINWVNFWNLNTEKVLISYLWPHSSKLLEIHCTCMTVTVGKLINSLQGLSPCSNFPSCLCVTLQFNAQMDISIILSLHHTWYLQNAKILIHMASNYQVIIWFDIKIFLIFSFILMWKSKGKRENVSNEKLIKQIIFWADTFL